MGKEYLDKAELYETISELEDLARQRVLDTPSNSPAYPRYLAQLQDRTNLKHKIYDMPTADVVEVVRCRDCKHYAGKWFCNICGIPSRRPNDFCSYGERKEWWL